MVMLAQSVAPLELVTGEPEVGLLGSVTAWAWIALGVVGLVCVSLMLVRTLGRDRSHRAEAERAFRALAGRERLGAEDRRVLARGARDAAVEPVACLLSLGAFDRVAQSSPAEFGERFAALRARLFPEADGVTLHA